jgi:hypothetical protein
MIGIRFASQTSKNQSGRVAPQRQSQTIRDEP